MDSRKVTTRQKLVESALYLFWLKGYEATSVAEILEQTGVNSGSFYHFFKRKEDLLLAVLQLYFDSLDSVIVQPVRERFDDPIERIFGILAFYRRNLVATGCTYGCPIGRLALEIPAEQTDVHLRLAANFDGWTGAVGKFLEEAHDRFLPGTDLGTLSNFVLTVMEGGVMQARTHRDLAPFDASVAHLRRYFELLTTRPPSLDDQADGSGASSDS
jgi:AcrR family transcriptional regulator